MIVTEGLRVDVAERRILGPVEFSADRSSWTGVIGPNGAGKTTLLRAVAGLVAYRGSVTVGGRDLARLDHRERARLVGYVPQAPVRPPGMTVHAYVGMGRTPHRGYFSGPRHRDARVVVAVLEELDLGSVAHRLVTTLSGGEAQRVAIARALAQEPDVLLLDEPTASLDLGHTQDVLALLERLRRSRETTVVTALHDLTVAARFADRLVLVADGVVAAAGPPSDLLERDLIRRHYGARVHVLRDPSGDMAVVPDTRPFQVGALEA